MFDKSEHGNHIQQKPLQDVSYKPHVDEARS